MTDSIDIPHALEQFIAHEVICCLGVAMPEEAVHVAPLRFWCDANNLNVYMTTSKNSEKMWWWREGLTSIKASVAIGTTSKLPYSLQMRGMIEAFDPSTDSFVVAQYSKIASELDDINDPDKVMIVFRPTWARYTDRGTKEKLMYPISLRQPTSSSRE